MTSKSAEHAPRALAPRAMQRAVHQCGVVVVLAIAGYDVAVHAAIGYLALNKKVKHVLFRPEAHRLSRRMSTFKSVAPGF